MSRFADALKRARAGSMVDPQVDDDRVGDAIRFFAPGQPAIVSPWNVDRDPAGPLSPPEPAREPPRRIWTERRPARVVEREPQPLEPRIRPAGPGGSDKLVTSSAIAPVAREQYSKLAAAIHQAQLERSLKVLMVTSAAPGEGKTLTAANVALTLSESYQRRVLLIDADFRHPSVHGLFGVSNARGLSDSLAGQTAPQLVHVTPRLSVLPAGSIGGDPIKALTSERMRLMIEDARTEFDWVIVDTAPIGLLPDAGLLASLADGTVFVIRAGKTAYDTVQRASETIGAERIVGVVLNGVAERDVSYGYYYGDYYASMKG